MSYKPKTHLSYQAAQKAWSRRLCLYEDAVEALSWRGSRRPDEQDSIINRYKLLRRHLKKALTELLKYRYGYVPHKPWHGKTNSGS
jgi:hypothetical protein